MSTWIDFKELRSKLRFGDVLSHYGVKVKRRGDRVTALCPLPGHPARTDSSPRTASLSIHLERNIFQCFGCKASGNVIDFVTYMEGFDPSNSEQFRKGALKAAEILTGHSAQENTPHRKEPRRNSGTTAPPVRRDAPSAVNAPLDFELKDLDAEHPYLLDRKFLPETIRHFGLGYCNRGMLQYRIAIPLHDIEGRLVGYAGRITKDSMITDECPKYRFPGDRERNGVLHQFRKSLLLYNAHRVKGPVDHLFVVEGFPATWWMVQAKYTSTVALMGSSCSEAQGDAIVRLTTPDSKIWILPDGNDAGVQCAHSVFERVAPYRFVRWVRLEHEEQPTDYRAGELAGLFG